MESIFSILVVDDDKNIVNLVERILAEKGYQVTKAYDAESALALIYENRPDLILLDILMPNIDGYTFCNTINTDESSRIRAIPIVIVTALRGELNKKYAEEMGAVGYITKPFKSEDLLDTVARYLEKPG